MHQDHYYNNPPIDEAICEFHFKPGQDWDLTIPGKLHIELADEYSGKPREQRALGVELDVQERQLSYNEGLARVQLVTHDGKRMVGIGPNILSVHMLRPYHSPNFAGNSGWVEFQFRIKRALESCWNVLQPLGVHRVGVRYINRIVIPQKMVMIGDYLKCALPEVTGLPSRLNSYVSRVEYTYTDNTRLVLSQGSIDAPKDHVALLLDLDVIWENAEPITRDKALVTVNDLHTREGEAFESVITDKARELFNAA
ncbi:MAG: TIGR04255 family protein [Caldilineaceae bacterium]|nr:TIGR04255 family protein [Caldilineaceae bacterium]